MMSAPGNRLRISLAGLIIVVVSFVAISCGGSASSDPPTSDSAASSPAPDPMPNPSTTTISIVPTSRPFAVADPQVVDLVDPDRPTIRDGVVIDGQRVLPTMVWRPTEPGRFPLVVFAHGYRLGPTGYARFCRELASMGYVVAAPSFPLADEARGNGLTRDDIPEEATDVAFVAHAIRSSGVGSSIEVGPYAAVGHSDGADVVLLVGYGAGRGDPDVGAIVAIAPDAMTGSILGNSVPMLLVHGTSDSTVPYSESRIVDVQVRAPHWFLTLDGAEHLPPVAEDTPWTPVLDAAVTMFLDATIGEFGGEIGGLTTMLDGLDRSSVTATN